jgi:hypothetical protein
LAEERITWTPANGINMEDPPIRVRANQCVEASNMLFENGVARTRPYAVRDTYNFWPAASVTGYRFARAVLSGTSPNSVVICFDAGSGFGLGKGGTAEVLSGPGFTQGSYEYDNITVVNGVFLIGNDITNGIYRHDPSTADYTSLGGPAAYRYVTSLYSRAIGAYGGGGAQAPRRVAWSVSGDETDWSGAGSGSTVLAETTDEISGAQTLQNILVIMRTMGITLGYPTQNATNPIRWETLVRMSSRTGCPWPSTVSAASNEIFYVGHDDVYHLDLNFQPQSIGRGIRRELLHWLARGVLFRGVTTSMDYGVPSGGSILSAGNEICDPRPRARYHLIPIMRIGSATFPTNRFIPHYSYDVAEGTWGRHTYSFILRGGCENFNLATRSDTSGISWNLTLFVDATTQDVFRWGEGSSGAGEVSDQGASMTSGVFVVGDPTHEYKCQRAHMVWARSGSHGSGEPDPAGVILRVRCKQQQRYVEQVSSPLDAYQVAEGSEDWQGTWIDLDGKPTGQFFQITLEIPPGFPMQIAQIELFLSDAGESKAGMYKQAA